MAFSFYAWRIKNGVVTNHACSDECLSTIWADHHDECAMNAGDEHDDCDCGIGYCIAPVTPQGTVCGKFEDDSVHKEHDAGHAFVPGKLNDEFDYDPRPMKPKRVIRLPRAEMARYRQLKVEIATLRARGLR